MLSLSAMIIVLLSLLILVYFKAIKEYIRYCILLEKLPTAKGKQFLIGHAGHLFGKSPEDAWLVGNKWVQESPHIFTVFIGSAFAQIAIMGAEEIEALIAPMKNLDKAKVYNFVHSWLKTGLLTSSGSKWQTRRKILTPAFHFSILLGFVDTFNRETANFIKDIEDKHLNQAVNITPLISNFTLLTMSETSMGSKLDLSTKEGMKYKNAIYQMEDILYKRVVTPWLWIQKIFQMSSLRKLETRTLNVLHSFTKNIIRKRSDNFKVFDEKPDESFGKVKHPLLDILLNAKFRDGSIDEDGIREEVDTFMFEGHDTTAMCLNFTTMLLACHSNIQEEVYQEIVNLLGPDVSKPPTYNQLQELPLLERCIKESLRLYPPVPMIGRKLSEDIPTKHGTVPKTTYGFIHIYRLHRNPEYWTDPDVFDPSRHSPENSQRRNPFTYIPFSAGPRNCIGQRFAMLEIKAFFCGLLRKFKLEPVDTPESLVIIHYLILRTRDGVKVKFVLR